MNTASLTLPEATELFYLALDTQDRFFEFWITATFAVIIACHLGSNILTHTFSIMISIMYLAFSANMISRWFLANGAVNRYRNDMASQANIQLQEQLIELSRILSVTTLLAGTAITIFFVWYTYQNQKSISENKDER